MLTRRTKTPGTLNILFLGGAKRTGMARLFRKAGQQRGLDVNIFSYELDPRVPVALVGQVITGLKWRDPNLYEHLHRTVAENSIDIIVPFVDPAVEVAARYAARYGDAFCACGDGQTARDMFDKTVAAGLFVRNGIPAPLTAGEGAGFPMIAKPRNGSASKGIRVLASQSDLDALADPGNYLIQEYVTDAVEYSVDCYVARDGRLLGAVPRRRLEVIGGEVSVSQTERNDMLARLTREAVERLGLTGPLTLQFLYDAARDRYLIMEVNPRLGGGAVLSVHAGLPLPGWIIDEATDCPVETVGDWTDGARMTRSFEEAVFAPDGTLI